MTITTITELKQEAYMMKDGEICTFPQWGNAKEAFSKESHYMEYNYNNGIIIFYDEEREAYVIPFFEGIFDILEKAGYMRNFSMYVPLSNWDVPELKDKWEAVKGRIKLIA